MNKQIVVSSNDSLDHFSSNSQERFVSFIDPPIELNGEQCYIGLRDILLELTEPRVEGRHIVFDVHLIQANGTIVNGRESTLLRRVVIKDNSASLYQDFGVPQFIPLKTGNIDHLEIEIKPVFPEKLAFAPQLPVRATLVIQDAAV